MIKRSLWTLLVVILAAGSGCQHHNLANSCGSGCPSGACATGMCGGGGCPSGACGIAGHGGPAMGGGQMARCGNPGCNGQCGSPGCLAAARAHMMAGRPPRVGQVPHHHNPANITPGPQSGSFAYPYYTTLGPRDFLMNNPPSIGR